MSKVPEGRRSSARFLARMLPGAVAAPAGFVAPCRTVLRRAPPKGRGWVHEILFEGLRLQARIEKGRVALQDADGAPVTKGLARVGLPQAVLFQILLAAISPVIDLALILSLVGTWFEVQAHGWAASSGDIDKMLTFWLVFTAIDLLAAFIAFALERREQWRLLWLLIPQRIGYRQIMYYVVLKALAQALRGPRVGWGKLERSGRVAA